MTERVRMWRISRSPWSRRKALKTAVAGLSAAALAACSGDDKQATTGGATTEAGRSQPATAAPPGTGKAYTARAGEKIPVAADTFFPTTGQKRGGTFRYNSQYAGFTANPSQAYQGDFILMRQVYQGLWQVIGASGALVLYASDRLEDVDQTTWVTHVRDNVKFHPKPPVNGRTVTADDVKYSFERVIADKTSIYSSRHNFIDKIEVVDRATVKFTGKFPFSSRYETNTVMMVPREAEEAFGDLNRKGIGTGAYMLDGEYDPSTTTSLTRHPEFMVPGRPFPDKVEYRHITDQAAQVSAFRSDQVDHIGRNLPKPVADSLKSAGGSVARQPFFGPTYLGIKTDRKPMDDPRVRQAMSLAIDRTDLIKKLEFGEAFVAGPIPWSLANWALPQEEVDKFYNIADYQANLAEAKKLVAAAGGDSLPEIELAAPGDLPTQANAAPLVAQMLRSAGFKIREELQPLTTIVRDRLNALKYELLIMQHGEGEEPFNFLQDFVSTAIPGASTRGGGTDPTIDAAVLAFLAEFEPERRVQKAKEAQRIIMPTYQNQVNLFTGWAYTVQKDYLKDFRPGGVVSAYWQFDEWLDK